MPHHATIKKKIYADFASDDLLIAEVYENESHHGQGQAFNKIISK